MAFTNVGMLLAFLVASATGNPFSTPAPTTVAPETTCIVFSPSMMFIAPGETKVVYTSGATVCDSYTCSQGSAPKVTTDCGAQSMCVDETDTTQCTCKACSGGSSGQTSNACEPSPCVNGGVCSVGATAGTYTCACAAPYYGTNCDVSYCAPSPCQNGATCVGDASRTPSYRCDCAPGYSDNQCQTAACSASTPPCLNGGTCSMSSAASSGYVCACAPGYGGATCNACVDQNVNCPAWKNGDPNYCTEPAYTAWMQSNCGFSCGANCSG